VLDALAKAERAEVLDPLDYVTGILRKQLEPAHPQAPRRHRVVRDARHAYVRDVLREHFCNKQAKDLTIEDKLAADAWIEEMFVFVDQHEEATVEWLADKAGDAVVRYGVDWFLLDPWIRSSASANVATARSTIAALKVLCAVLRLRGHPRRPPDHGREAPQR
jgi:hypothetical protein